MTRAEKAEHWCCNHYLGYATSCPECGRACGCDGCLADYGGSEEPALSYRVLSEPPEEPGHVDWIPTESYEARSVGIATVEPITLDWADKLPAGVSEADVEADLAPRGGR